MIEFAVVNEWIAAELQARGFKLLGRSKLAWYFEDSELLERTVSELVEALQEIDK
jgi:hypothetical protein